MDVCFIFIMFDMIYVVCIMDLEPSLIKIEK